MADRELLELAARAYWGDEIDDVCAIEWDDADQCIAYTHADNQDHNGNDRAFLWNPLADDGDALRLQIALGTLYPCCVTGVFRRDAFPYASASIVLRDGSEVYVEQPIEDDVADALRRAIVRAAASIGEKKR